MMASESVALKFLGYTSMVDILPGQAVIIQRGSEPVFSQVEEPKAYAPDIFVGLSCHLISKPLWIKSKNPPTFRPVANSAIVG